MGPRRQGYFEHASTMQIIVNGKTREAPEGSTVRELLADLGLAQRPVAVELNLQICRRQDHAQRQLQAGDCLEVVTLVGGG